MNSNLKYIFFSGGGGEGRVSDFLQRIQIFFFFFGGGGGGEDEGGGLQ